jgi:hypothetical protein
MVDTSVSTGAPGAPFAAGWASAATAVHGIRSFTTPMLLALEPAGLPPIVIDPRHRAFAWSLPISDFPAAPESVSVATQAVTPDAPPAFPLPGRPLDALLWMIGRTAFADEAAPWLVHGDRYRLSRWPNLTDLPHDSDELTMIAVLANGWASVPELAVATGVPRRVAQRLVNALALMDLLRVLEPEPDAAPPLRPRTERRGLFARLRDRLGL